MLKQLVGVIAGLGVPGLVLLVVMSASGFAGAAALTTALAALGGPFGMLGGIAALGVLAFMAKGLAEYGLDAIFEAVVDQLIQTGRSIDDIIDEVRSMPLVPEEIKSIIISKLNQRRRPDYRDGTSAKEARRILVSPVPCPVTGQAIQAWEPASGARYDLLTTKRIDDTHAECLISGTNTFVWHVTWTSADRIAFAPTRNLGIGSTYRLEQNGSRGEIKVEVTNQVVDGCWIGRSAQAEGNSEHILVISRKM